MEKAMFKKIAKGEKFPKASLFMDAQGGIKSNIILGEGTEAKEDGYYLPFEDLNLIPVEEPRAMDTPEECVEEVAGQMGESLKLWKSVLSKASEDGWIAKLEFTDDDIANAIYIMVSLCSCSAIKHGFIDNPLAAAMAGASMRHTLRENFGIDIVQEN